MDATPITVRSDRAHFIVGLNYGNRKIEYQQDINEPFINEDVKGIQSILKETLDKLSGDNFKPAENDVWVVMTQVYVWRWDLVDESNPNSVDYDWCIHNDEYSGTHIIGVFKKRSTDEELEAIALNTAKSLAQDLRFIEDGKERIEYAILAESPIGHGHDAYCWAEATYDHRYKVEVDVYIKRQSIQD